MWFRIILFLIMFLHHSGFVYGGSATDRIQKNINKAYQPPEISSEEGGNANDITWFRDQLKISPKYQEEERGIFGFSWPHFITMIFLICSLIIALVAMVVRHRRTKELLNLLLKEEKEDELKS